MRILGIIAATFMAAFALAPSAAHAEWKKADCGGPNNYLIGLASRTGVWVDRLGPVCGSWKEKDGKINTTWVLPMLATSTGGTENPRAMCPAGTAVSRIQYDAPRINGMFVAEHILITCRAIRPPHAVSANQPFIPSEGSGVSDEKRSSCFLGVWPCIYDFGAAGPDKDSDCGADRLATGFEANVAQFVGAIRLVCRRNAVEPPPPPPPPAPIDLATGGSFPLGLQGTGSQINARCGAGEALVGITTVGSSYVDLVGARCAPFANRSWSGNPNARGTIGNSGTPIGVANCAAPGAVTAAEGDTSSFQGLITRIRLRCGAAATGYVGSAGPVNMETWSHRVITCGPNNVATGLYGWVGPTGSLKSFGLHCAPASSFGGGSSAPPPVGIATGFAGNWQVTINDGYTFPMTLVPQGGGGIAGSYDSGRRNGTISNGAVTGSNLSFNWVQTGTVKGSGTGNFHLDSANTISGTWSFGVFGGTWTGVRKP